MKDRHQLRRRDFLATSAAAASIPYFIPEGVLAQDEKPGANDRLVVGHIGIGGMGNGHLGRMVKFQEMGLTSVAAVCDVDEGRLASAAKRAVGATPYRDYRYICQRKDIDAVVIATPDHWHAVQTVHACESGKHVYVEKPASVTVEEGQAMVTAARRNHRKVQVGAQGRTGWGAYYTCRAIRNGIVGKVSKVTCWHYANPVDNNPVADGDPPPQLDWDLWLGPLPWRPYNQRYLHGVFRWLLESGGGQIRDRGAHQFSTIMWCMNADHQVSYTVEATGTAPTMGLWDCPIDMNVVYNFTDPDWTLTWGQPGNKVGKSEFGNVFWGENGDHLVLEWEGAYRPAEPRAMEFKLPPGGEDPYRIDAYDDFNMNHAADWFKAIREPDYLPAVDIEIGHRIATLCNLGNISYRLGRKLQWDGVKQQVVGDDQANRLLGVPQRHPYHL
ncbi:MAG: Gfo/Idh/MocA family oxidoreductase [Planctomycetes bacterium]|nr:Gfo/Idh/MocA family oxidoreductase [Planctomycetota bacterium]